MSKSTGATDLPGMTFADWECNGLVHSVQPSNGKYTHF